MSESIIIGEGRGTAVLLEERGEEKRREDELERADEWKDAEGTPSCHTGLGCR